MRRKIITKDCIGLIKTINIIPMFIFIEQNPLNLWQAAWLLMSFFLEVVYLCYFCRMLVLPHEGKTLQLNKRDECYCLISAIFSLVSAFVAAVAMTSDNLSLKYTLIAVWAILVVLWIISQTFLDRKILKTQLIDKFDFTKITKERAECTKEDAENVSICLTALIIMSFVQAIPALAIIFEETMLIVYIMAAVLCSLLLLTLFYCLYKKVKPLKNKMILTYLIYVAVVIIEGVVLYLAHNNVDWLNEYLREIVFIPYCMCIILIWILLVFPGFKHYRAMMAYLQDNNES